MVHFGKSNLAAMALVAAAFGPAALAQDTHGTPDRVDLLMQRLYLKLATTLNGGPSDTTTLLSLSPVGIPISPKLDSDKNPADAHYLNELFDAIPLPAPVFKDSGQRYSSVYGSILTHKVTASASLTAEEIQRRDKAMALMDGPEFVAYEKYRVQYENAVAALEIAKQNAATEANRYSELKAAYEKAKLTPEGKTATAPKAPGPLSLSLTNAPQNLLSKWKSQGYKATIESASNTLNEITNKDGGAWWDALQTRFLKGQGMDQTYAVKAIPAPSEWNAKGDEGWTEFQFSSSEETSNMTYAHKDMEASAKIGAGLFSVSVKVGWAKTDVDDHSAGQKCDIRFKLKRITLRRPWFEPLVFASRGWWFNAQFQGKIVSNGQALGTGNGPEGMMPLILNSIILCKDLRIDAAWAAKQFKSAQSSSYTSVSASFGCFSLGGGYSQNDYSSSFKATADDAGISAPGVQIIGYVSNVVPKSPLRTN